MCRLAADYQSDSKVVGQYSPWVGPGTVDLRDPDHLADGPGTSLLCQIHDLEVARRPPWSCKREGSTMFGARLARWLGLELVLPFFESDF